jgi:hypothetical protein
VILWRLLPWAPRAVPTEPGGALWFPRELQGAGRHDNPARYGCLYAAEQPVSAAVEALAPFTATGRLSASMLVREGRPLALTQLELDDRSRLVNLDSPQVLIDVRLRPSQVATGARTVTQAYAERIFNEHPDALGLRWWSTIEASFTNLTLYDRAAPHMRFIEATRLTVEHQAVREAAALLGLLAGEK